MKYLKKFEKYENKQIKGIIKHEIGERPFVLGEDGKIYHFRCSDLNEDYPIVTDLYTKDIDNEGSWSYKSIKPYIGMVVRFWIAVGNGSGYNFEIFKEDQI